MLARLQIQRELLPDGTIEVILYNSGSVPILIDTLGREPALLQPGVGIPLREPALAEDEDEGL